MVRNWESINLLPKHSVHGIWINGFSKPSSRAIYLIWRQIKQPQWVEPVDIRVQKIKNHQKIMNNVFVATFDVWMGPGGIPIACKDVSLPQINFFSWSRYPLIYLICWIKMVIFHFFWMKNVQIPIFARDHGVSIAAACPLPACRHMNIIWIIPWIEKNEHFAKC